ncbi:hypothetical protein LTR56_006219 [Elasticomyces elasticus]|nr:hypothetical protein LTR56_006219 [Elasticomyces elasticus]KAK3666572.1 hypothetical protein LTR22_002516 [Elasticomyces elasticus]
MLPTQTKEGIAVEVTYWDDRSELEDVVLGTTFATRILLRDFDMRSAPGVAIVITCNTAGELLESNEHTDYYWLKAEDVCEFLDAREVGYLKGRRTERLGDKDWFLEPGDVSWSLLTVSIQRIYDVGALPCLEYEYLIDGSSGPRTRAWYAELSTDGEEAIVFDFERSIGTTPATANDSDIDVDNASLDPAFFQALIEACEALVQTKDAHHPRQNAKRKRERSSAGKGAVKKPRRQHKKQRGETGKDIWLACQLACEDQDDEEMLPLAASGANGDGLQADPRRHLLAPEQANEQALLRNSTSSSLQTSGVKVEAVDDDSGAATVPVDTTEPAVQARAEQTPLSTTGAASSPRLSEEASELIDRLEETRLKLEATRLKQDETRLKQEEIGLELEAIQLRGRLRTLNERT